MEPVEAPGAGGDELAWYVIAWVEGLQRVLDDDGLTRPSRRRTDGVVHHVEQLPHRHRRRAWLVRALVVAAIGDHEVLTRGQQRIEKELAVLAARVTVAHSWVLRGDVVAIALDMAREAAVVEAEQAHDLVWDGAHRDKGAHGQVAGAEVGPRRLALQALGQERADVVTAEGDGAVLALRGRFLDEPVEEEVSSARCQASPGGAIVSESAIAASSSAHSRIVRCPRARRRRCATAR